MTETQHGCLLQHARSTCYDLHDKETTIEEKNFCQPSTQSRGWKGEKNIYIYRSRSGTLHFDCERVLLNAHAGSHMSVLTVNPSVLHAGKGQHGMATWAVIVVGFKLAVQFPHCCRTRLTIYVCFLLTCWATKRKRIYIRNIRISSLAMIWSHRNIGFVGALKNKPK